jgi:hypothetical protein
VEVEEEGDASPNSFAFLAFPVGLSLSDSEKTEALPDSLEAQYHPVNYKSPPALIEAVEDSMCAYEYASVCNPRLNRVFEF